MRGAVSVAEEKANFVERGIVKRDRPVASSKGKKEGGEAEPTG